MLRFIRSHITNTTDFKSEELNDFVSFSKSAIHGFPQKVSCISLDENLGLLAIGTKDGRVRIVGAEGAEWSATIEGNLQIAFLYFARGTGVLIALCHDPRSGTQSFYRCQIINERVHLTRFSQERHLKRITCCEMMNRSDGNSALLIGTIIGNIYALWIQNLELVEYLVFLDTILKEVLELEGAQKSIDRIVVHPEDRGQIFLLFNRSHIVLYDTVQDEVLQVFSPKNTITNIFCHLDGSKLLASHVDGSYAVFGLIEDLGHNHRVKQENLRPFGTVECIEMTKIVASKSSSRREEFVIFGGGIPSASHGDRYTVSIFCGEKSLVLDFDSPVIDFVVFEEDGAPSGLFVLCEEELVAIDLQDPLWAAFPLPHFHPLHSSPITAISAYSGLSERAVLTLGRIAEEQRETSGLYSRRKWPLRRRRSNSKIGSDKKDTILTSKEITLLITGHENGCVNIWRTNGLAFIPWISHNSARHFEGFLGDDLFPVDNVAGEQSRPFSATSWNSSGRANNTEDSDELALPPFRKAGLYDPFSDDHRLSVQKLDFDCETANLVIGGRAGQLLVCEGLQKSKKFAPTETLVLDLTEGADHHQQSSSRGTRTRGESAIQASSTSSTFPAGFCLISNVLLQFKPAVPITALAWNASRGLVAAGTEFGYVICCPTKNEILYKNPLISSFEIVQISDMDGPLSRFKSVKKTLRQSFRRKKRMPNEAMSSPDLQSEDFAPNVPGNCRTVEREIVQRTVNPNALGGETPNSLVKVVRFLHCPLDSSGATADEHLFVGTHGGSVLIHSLPLPRDEPIQGEFSPRQLAPLIKEVRLQHHAPIVNVECLQDSPMISRLIIYTEEQIRSFMLPGLKAAKYKCRFTATEGSKVRKANTVVLRSSKARQKNPEKFIGIVTNRGEVFILSSYNPRKHIHFQFTSTTDAAGITSAVVSTEGELYFLRPGGSEIERCSLSALT